MRKPSQSGAEREEMTRDELIRMASDCGLMMRDEPMHGVERFAALVAAAEREACAKVCDGWAPSEYATGKVDHEDMGWTQVCAMDIRARREK